MSQPSSQHRRMVVLAGPHKSASSSVQELFMKYASNNHARGRTKHPSLQQWVWPWNPRRRSYLPRKGFAPLVTEDVGFHRLLWDTILNVWNATKTTATAEKTWQHDHLIWGTEELDRFGPVPWSHRNGLTALYQVWNLTRPSSMDIVVNYRRPRHGQWISIWKQLERKEHNSNYATFLCDSQEYNRLWEYLDCVANPLGLTQALLEFWHHHQQEQQGQYSTANVTVHLLDMQGIAQVQRDVGHVVACDVLGVPCTTNHWLPNVQEQPILQNAKSGNPGLSKDQLVDLEWILRQRDCWYRTSLEKWASLSTSSSKAPRLQLHYADTLWDQCGPKNGAEMFANTTFLLDVLQSQVGCGTLSANRLHHLLYGTNNNNNNNTSSTGRTMMTLTRRKGQRDMSAQSLSSLSDSKGSMVWLQLQVAMLYVWLVAIMGWYGVRRCKVSKYFLQQQRRRRR